MALQLAVIRGERRGDLFPIAEDRTVRIGRHLDNDIVLPDNQVSRRHAELTVEAAGFAWLRDVGSRNGTRIDGRGLPSEGSEVVPGCCIDMACVSLLFHEDGPITAGQWCISHSPRWLLSHVVPGASVRKLSLFIRACAQRFVPRMVEAMTGPMSFNLPEDPGESLSIAADWWAFMNRLETRELQEMDLDWLIRQSREALRWPQHAEWTCGLLRDLFGNPFHPVGIDPAWFHGADHIVPRLAQTIEEEQAFDRLPILADALEDAGCAEEAILDHCRGPGPHYCGCWVVDLLLGMS
jgi:hypothetical protein